MIRTYRNRIRSIRPRFPLASASVLETCRAFCHFVFAFPACHLACRKDRQRCPFSSFDYRDLVSWELQYPRIRLISKRENALAACQMQKPRRLRLQGTLDWKPSFPKMAPPVNNENGRECEIVRFK